MSVRRQLFWTLTSFISAMAAAFVLVTIFVVKPTVEHIRVADRSREIEEISKLILNHYEQNATLDGIQLKLGSMSSSRPDANVILMTPKKERCSRRAMRHMKTLRCSAYRSASNSKMKT